MAASLQILDTNGTTVITSKSLGNIATPGSSSTIKLFVQNIGTTSATSVTVARSAFGTSDGDDFTYIANDVAGSPGTFGQTTITLGTIAALASTPFWVQIVQPAGLTADDNPRRVNVVATGLTV